MTPRQFIMKLMIIAAALAAAGCGRDREVRPPEIMYGRQECDSCRMIISDERFAAALVLEQADGERLEASFDDVNCLFDYLSEHAALRLLACYVHDMNTRQWLAARDAAYLLSDSLQTPMGSGVAAASTREALASLPQERTGRTLDFASLQTHFAHPQPMTGGVTP